jgi:hypothetical protein
MRAIPLFVLLWAACTGGGVDGGAVDPLSPSALARQLLRRCLTSATSLLLPLPVLAQRGAFELDAEMYLRNLLDASTSRISESKARRPIYNSPRALNPTYAEDVLDILRKRISSAGKIPIEMIQGNVTAQLPLYLPFFRLYAPIRRESLDDQYFFDINIYLLYLIAESVIPDSESRILLRERIGDDMLSWMSKKRLLEIPKPRGGIPEVALGIGRILETFKGIRFIESFTFDAEDMLDVEYVSGLFEDVSIQLFRHRCNLTFLCRTCN